MPLTAEIAGHAQQRPPLPRAPSIARSALRDSQVGSGQKE
jgi:hypothetical protein